MSDIKITIVNGKMINKKTGKEIKIIAGKKTYKAKRRKAQR